jgi:ribosomal protein L34
MAVAIAPQPTSRMEAYGGNSSREISPRDYYDRYAIVTADDSALGHASVLASLSVDSPKSRKKAARAQRLYEDAVARRQRLSDKKDEAAKHERDELEECRREALLQQRARQRFYNMRDTRTHIERENDMLKKREERRNVLRLEKQRQEQLQYSECTFQPKIYTKREDREGYCFRRKSTGGRSVVRSSSCDAVIDRTPMLQDDHYVPAPAQSLVRLDAAGGTKLQILLDKQLGLIRKLTNIDEEAQMARQSRAQAATPMSEIEIREAEVQFYKKQLDVVHSLERLDMDILELPKVQLDALLAKGFRLGLGEGARQGLKSPREASRRAFAESPRNNLRIMRSSDIVRAGEGVLVHERSFLSE